jgi:alkylhydroperoxidase family enzyme
MARIPLDHPRTLTVRLLEAYSRRRFGAVLDPGLVLMHHRGVMRAFLATERGAARLHALPPTLRALAVMSAATEIGCQWCMDFGYWEFHHQGVEQAKLRAVANWRSADIYDDTERAVLSYAADMTATPPTVDDATVADLRTRLSDEQLVELTYWVALENTRSRINAAMGLTGQGFRDTCELQPAR